MVKKINSEKILRLVYEAYKRRLTEDTEEQPQQQPMRPIDYHVSFYNGRFYFNITVSDKSLYGAIGNLRSDLIKKLIFKNNRKTIEDLFGQYGKDFVNTKEYKNLLSKYSKYYQLNSTFEEKDPSKRDNNNPDALVFNTPILHPDDLYDEDGNLNPNSDDLRRIKGLLINFSKNIGHNISNEEIENAIKSAFYGVKNMFFKEKMKDIEDDAKSLFFEVCKTIGEDETKKLLRTIQVGSQGMIFDSQLSLLNRLRVISQATKYDQNGGNQVQTVSYLQTERQWRKSGRQVINYDYPYYIVVAHKGRMGDKTEDALAKSMGYDRLEEENDFLARKHRNKLVNKTYDRNGFGYHTVYDVQATQPMQGYDDEWSTKPALKNNLTGELNDIAKERFNALNGNDNGEQENRTNKLNKLFNTTDYEGVNAIYQAVCMTANKKPYIPNDGDTKAMIRETGEMIDGMLREKLSSFAKGGGHIALPKNYQMLVPIGRIIIQSIIGLPMDSAPAIEWTDEHKEMTAALSSIVNTISNEILKKKEEVLNIQKANITEMVNLYSPLFVFEETFNKTLKLIEENAKYI